MILATLGAGVAAPSVGAVEQAPPEPLTQPAETLPVLVELDEVAPVILAPGVPWSVRGTVRNVSTSPVPVEGIRAATAYRSLDTRQALEAWTGGQAGLTPSRVVGIDTIGAALAPGASTSFWIKVDREALRPSFSFGTLPLAIEVVTPDDTVRGRLRSVLPWYAGEPAAEPLRLSWVVPLTLPARPRLTDQDPDVRAQTWLATIGPGSPARTWLEGLPAQAATFAVDPTLISPPAPAGRVTDPPPAPEPLPTPAATPKPTPSTSVPVPPLLPAVPGATQEPPPEQGPALPSPGAPDQESLETATAEPGAGLPGVELPEVLTEVERAQLDLQRRLSELDEEQLWWLPAADPDLAALVDLPAPPDLVAELVPGQLAESPLVAGRLVESGRHDIAWPTWSRVSDASLRSLHQLWPTGDEPLSAVMVPDTAVTVPATGTASGAVQLTGSEIEETLLAYDTTLSGLLAAAPAPQHDGATVQRLVAETLAIYQRSPAQRRHLVLAPPRGAVIEPETLTAMTAALDQAAWLTQVPAAAALEAVAPGELTGTPLGRPASGDTTAYPPPGPTPLSEARIQEVEALRDMLGEVSTILPSDQAVQRWQPVLDGLYSTRWRDNPSAWRAPLVDLQEQVDQVQAGVRVNPTTVNFLADEGLIQMTVVNTLPTEVQDLRLHVEPGNGRLRVVEPPEPITIGAQSRATVDFRARAVAAGEVPVRAYLTTPAGLPIGEPQVLEVRVRPTGAWIYWLLGGVAGVILVLGLARALRRPGVQTRQDVR